MVLSKITEKLRLKKLTVSNFYQFVEKQDIEFSKNKQVVIIMGNNDSGKTNLVKAIKTGLGLEGHDKKFQKPIVECNFDSSIINKENEKLFFVDPEVFTSKNYFKGMEFDFEMISETNKLFLKHSNQFAHVKEIRIISGELNAISYNGSVISLAAEEWLLLCYSALIVIRKKYTPNSFLVIDAPFGRISEGEKQNLLEVLIQNTTQLVLFVTDMEYLSHIVEYQLIKKENNTIVKKKR